MTKRILVTVAAFVFTFGVAKAVHDVKHVGHAIHFHKHKAKSEKGK